ncbi:MAG: methyltransferase domain-containing protein [Candidatus Latescibacterota bacterium]|nr:MAG: methyltransferase domain-containing protein [Candidatus Latescibacterota bacterium]
MKTDGGEYIHGSDSREQKRLSLLNDLLNDASLEAMDLKGGEKILDIGSGLGQFTRMMARTVGTEGEVVGVERDPRQIEEAIRQAKSDGEHGLAEFRRGDAVDIPLEKNEWGTFDVAHARFLLEHVPDPLSVVRTMVRAVKVGGRVILEDDDHDVMRIWPELPVIEQLWRTYADSFRKLGNDPFIGRRLVSLLHEAGANPARNQWLPFSSCAGNPLFDAFVENFAGVLGGARQTILDTSSITASDFDKAISDLKEWARLPDAALWYGTFWAEGVRRE